MTNETKQFIATEVANIASKSSQERVANRARTSTATINHIINGKWNLIRDEMWRKVQVNLKLNTGWNSAVTNNFMILTDLLTAAQKTSLSIGISFDAGAGKSHAYKIYERKFENVFYVECKNSWSKKSYVKALLQSAGLPTEGTIEELIENFTNHLMTLDRPILIIDQMDKLKETAFDLFMDFYNDLDGHCAFVVSGVPALEKKVKLCVLRNKVGYAEFWSRIGRKFIKLDPLSHKDVKSICEANGIDDQDYIDEQFNSCMGDLRVVKRAVQKHFLVQLAKAKKSA